MNSLIKLGENKIVQVVVDAPLNKVFDYEWVAQAQPQVGQIVSLEFGRNKTIGVIVSVGSSTDIEPTKIKSIQEIAPLPPLPIDLIDLASFSATYYQKPLGEILLSSIPKAWRDVSRWSLLSKQKKQKEKPTPDIRLPHHLNAEQQVVIEELLSNSNKKKYQTYLLHGVTGGGKTLVYLQWVKELLKEKGQVLMLVPEINLTPQLEASVKAALPGVEMATLHSGLSERVRADNWANILRGQAQVILGTRMSVMCPAPNLKAIIVDEEHDLSYKQQEGSRYSARDLAIWRANRLQITGLLVSATPSLETWNQVKKGRYKKLEITQKAKTSQWPTIELINVNQEVRLGKKLISGLSQTLIDEIDKVLAHKKQALIFLNRRGYAPVISCQSCGWLSNCEKCSTYMVLHKQGSESRLCCHHCGLMKRVPRQCPECGNIDLSPLGKGTQKLEEFLMERFPASNVVRLDADTTRLKGSTEELFSKIHDGTANIIVGTQMIIKGHDYQHVGLVGVIDADVGLFSQDFRAAERLFAQLMQVAGRAGRSEGSGAKVMVQTNYPEALPYQYLIKNDVKGFLNQVLSERELLGLPPYSYQALVHAEHKSIQEAKMMLIDAAEKASEIPSWPKSIVRSDIVPRAIQKIAGKERLQMLIESSSRTDLQAAVEILQEVLASNKKTKGVGWYLERDPVQI